MNLKSRLSLLAVVLILASAAAVWISVQTLAERIITEWALRYVEKQVLYDKERVLQPLLREIVLARQLSSSPVLIEWLEDPDNILAEYHGLMELERYRESFTDSNYFLGVLRNGHYYYNNAENEFAGDQMRYRLNPSEPADSWFYDLIEQNRDLHINVNPDAHLGVTKLWVDVLLRNASGEVLGVAGTGLNLSGFLNDIVDSGEEGITSLFVNHQGAIQLYRDQSMIDFASLTKDDSDQSRLGQMMQAEDYKRLQLAMAQVKAEPQSVVSRFVTIDGTRYLAGVAYLPEIDWYEVTLMDLNRLLPLSRFNSILMIFGISLLITVLVFRIVLGRVVLEPLLALDRAIRRFRKGEYTGEPLDVRASGEVARLVEEFEKMSREVYEARTNLEQKVQERTEALNQLSQTDPLTGLLNRRGMDQRLQEELKRSAREGRPLGIIWIDLDLFKEINDRYGHAVGDEALVVVATVLRSVLREYDAASRWGGDEFLIMIRDADRGLIEHISERLLRVIRGQIVRTPCGASLSMTFSIGASLTHTEDHEEVLRQADAALYAAKQAGRNGYRLYTDALDAKPVPETADLAEGLAEGGVKTRH
ncbi:diguanylate cyclase [Marinobacterium sp. MBR-109]|uniref:sensor domain-containing diguanylate cyclase n=1 Tax=Marinobacterium sp. MBR-109 TaxID=3156462 RepID=UPI003397912D